MPGFYPNCDEHVRRTGLRNTEIAAEADIHEQSVRRCRAGTAATSEATVRRIINALNRLYYNQNPPPIDFDSEYEPA